MQTVNLTVIGNKIELIKISNNYEKLKFYKKNFKLNCEDFEQQPQQQLEKVELKELQIDNLRNYGINSDKRVKQIREAVSISEFIRFLTVSGGRRGRLLTPPSLTSLKQSNIAASLSSPSLINIQKKASNLYQEHFGKYYQQLNDVIGDGKLMSLSSSTTTTLSSTSSLLLLQ